MIAIKAHYDGKVIVPDEPVNLPVNQAIVVQVEPAVPVEADFDSWIGLAGPGPDNPNRRFFSDDDLWDKTK